MHTGAHIQNKATSTSQTWIFFLLNVPGGSLLSNIVDFVPCDRYLQRAHILVARIILTFFWIIIIVLPNPSKCPPQREMSFICFCLSASQHF